MLEGGSFTHSSVAEFLNKAVEPPPEISVSNAVRLLQDIGAFEVCLCWCHQHHFLPLRHRSLAPFLLHQVKCHRLS